MKLKSIAAGAVFFLASCTNGKNNDMLINARASLPSSFKFGEQGLKVITSFINPEKHTTSVLYGNAPARETAAGGGGKHRAGEVLALVTWDQQDDPNWFGALIPGTLRSVEYVRTRTDGGNVPAVSYQSYSGAQLTPDSDTTGRQTRINFIFEQKAAEMP